MAGGRLGRVWRATFGPAAAYGLRHPRGRGAKVQTAAITNCRNTPNSPAPRPDAERRDERQ